MSRLCLSGCLVCEEVVWLSGGSEVSGVSVLKPRPPLVPQPHAHSAHCAAATTDPRHQCGAVCLAICLIRHSGPRFPRSLLPLAQPTASDVERSLGSPPTRAFTRPRPRPKAAPNLRLAPAARLMLVLQMYIPVAYTTTPPPTRPAPPASAGRRTGAHTRPSRCPAPPRPYTALAPSHAPPLPSDTTRPRPGDTHAGRRTPSDTAPLRADDHE